MKHCKHIIFDAYGTLFDLNGALGPAINRLEDNAEHVLQRWRTLQLEYAWLSALSQRYVDFEIATRNAFRDALSEKGIEDISLVEALIEGFKTVQAYPDAVRTLDALQDSGYTTCILSNGSPSILASASIVSGLDQFLNRILSVDEVKTYKPAREAYSVATRAFNIPAEDAIFVSSNWWDVDGARAFGYQTVWIDRGAYSWPPSLSTPKVIVNSLSEICELVE